MQRMFNLSKWMQLEEGTGMAFPGLRPREVRLEVNAPDEVRLFALEENALNGEPRFLALVKGRDTIGFYTAGRFSLVVEGGSCSIYTADGDDISFVNLEPVVFTRIAARRKRNPELEYIAALMQRNLEKRLEAQSHELQRLFEGREKARAALPQAPVVSPGSGGERGQASDTGSPGAPAPATG